MYSHKHVFEDGAHLKRHPEESNGVQKRIK